MYKKNPIKLTVYFIYCLMDETSNKFKLIERFEQAE